MPKWICKVGWSKGQCRVTIPKGLIEEMDWKDVEVLVMRPVSAKFVSVRRFENGESLKGPDEGNRPRLN